MYGRRRKLSAEETAANAAREQRKMLESKTCQCCARQIFAETGLIAHHGYERPGDGWQTDSCMGARYLPFEVDRGRLGELIDVLVTREALLVELRRKTADEERSIRRESTNYNGPRVKMPGRMGHGEQPTVTLDFTRANFDQLINENTGPGKLYRYEHDAVRARSGGFDELKARELDWQDTKIGQVRDHIAECRKRFEGWKQTHKRVGDEWVKL